MVVMDQSKKQWIILMLHQIDDEDTEYGTTPDNLEQVVDFVNHSNISVVLPSQALGVERRNE